MKQDKQKNKLDEAVEQSTDSCTNDESNVKNSKDQPKEYGGRKDGLGACPRIEVVARNNWFESVFSLI